jgi:hypothetical protein
MSSYEVGSAEVEVTLSRLRALPTLSAARCRCLLLAANRVETGRLRVRVAFGLHHLHVQDAVPRYPIALRLVVGVWQWRVVLRGVWRVV